MLLRNAVLPDKRLVDSNLAAPAPLAFNLSSGNANLVLDGCTVATSCDNLAQFAAWVGGQHAGSMAQVRGGARGRSLWLAVCLPHAVWVGRGRWGRGAHSGLGEVGPIVDG